MKKTLHDITPQELYTIFPQALTDARKAHRMQKKLLAEFESNIPALLQYYFDYNAERSIDPNVRAIFNKAFVKQYYTNIKEDLEALIAYNQAFIETATIQKRQELPEMFANMVEQSSTMITSMDIERAKRVPIRQYLKCNKAGFALCIWHNEKTPSMKYYPKKNTVHCFGGCQKSASVIDVIMYLHGIDFKTAVLFLTNG